MAQRYGGAFSPQAGRGTGASASPTPELRGPLPGRARVSLLMAAAVLGVPFAFLGGGATELATHLGGAGLAFGGAVLTREGLKAQAAWAARKVARRPAIPRKIFGALTVGAGAGLMSLDGLAGIPSGVVFGAVASALHLAAFGLDPMSDKGMEGIDRFQSDRVARTIEDAERTLAAMRDAVARTRDRQAIAAVDRLAVTVESLFRTVEDDPRDLTAARKYLGVYLDGARDATVKFADFHAATNDDTAKADYLDFVDDLRRGMESKRETLLISDRTALDVEIEVLRDRLRRDGLPTGET
ncbi:5-bromo-4-chloroindolyl phosphate hydrolysis family protein [Jannaschia sp. LMIT008]|uniref:5-bromo-4-chloroindolyl phosphate hydrolysis family protein n=1 Tax=Jannaschia maritima TaxID=3032585 RepID=UPI002811DAEC|nr:5-bromo-4-chloroindolyl phosphate hydrolysis family protein [Jannaschia sp. LMIT008]